MIEAYKARTDRNVRGTTVVKGQQLFAVKKGVFYFIWSYTDEAFAKQMDEKLTGPVSEVDKAANWRLVTGELVVSDRTKF